MPGLTPWNIPAMFPRRPATDREIGRPGRTAGMERQLDPVGPLLPRVAAGDASAVRACIDRYGGLIWSLVRRKGLRQSEAEDIVQEIFVELWRSAGSFDASIASETTFVAMVARRRLIDRLRSASSRTKHEAEQFAERAREIDRSMSAASEEVEVAEEARAARDAMRMLSEAQRETLLMAVVHGMSHADIAAATGTPLGTVKTNVRRGLIRLREILGERGSGGLRRGEA